MPPTLASRSCERNSSGCKGRLLKSSMVEEDSAEVAAHLHRIAKTERETAGKCDLGEGYDCVADSKRAAGH